MALLGPNLSSSRPAVWWATGWSGHLSPPGACRNWSWRGPHSAPSESLFQWLESWRADVLPRCNPWSGPWSPLPCLRGAPASNSALANILHLQTRHPFPSPARLWASVRAWPSSLDPCSSQLLSPAPGPSEVAHWPPRLPSVGFRECLLHCTQILNYWATGAAQTWPLALSKYKLTFKWPLLRGYSNGQFSERKQ